MTSAEAVSPRGQGSSATAASVTSATSAGLGPAPLIPAYGRSTLADLATSLLASLGVPGEANPLDLAPAGRACLLVIDGLGWELLREHPAAAPFLAELARSGQALTAGFPATTVTSLSSLGTGRPPGQHGMLGYQVAVPGTGRLLNALRWDKRVDPLEWQPGSTIFERAAAAGIAPFRVAQGSFRESGLSTAVMRGARYRSADTLGALASQAAAALRDEPRALAMVYHAGLDSTGHALGCTSDAWRFQLGHVDRLAEQLAGALPPGTAMYVTADHGMVDVGAGDRVDADRQPELRDGVALLGGEPRARHVYALPGAAADVLARWQEVLGGAAWVASRDEAIDEGWFGPVGPGRADRIGDVVAACTGSWAIVATREEPRESALAGMHGSLAAADQLVPLLPYRAG
ncbi:MAG TPA: nucleotide pyrophosphatase/phosphodiesterase family protein [Streptosporangiaceae bacterium]